MQVPHSTLSTIRFCCSAYLSLLVFLEIFWAGLPRSSRTVLSWWPMVPLGPGGFLRRLACPKAPFSVPYFTSFSRRSGTFACGWGCPQSVVCRRFAGLRPLLGGPGHMCGRGNKPGYIDTLQAWMSSNRLRLNPTKTQFIWFGTRQQLAKIDLGSLAIKYPHFTFSSSVRDLGVTLDQELTFVRH